MRLSDRLETVVSMVRPAESAADIGTDHGHVPVELVRRGTVKRALAMDVTDSIDRSTNIMTHSLQKLCLSNIRFLCFSC